MRPDIVADEAAVDDDEEGEDDDDEEEGDDEPEDWWTYWQDPPDDVPDDGHEKPLRMTAKEKVRASWHPSLASAAITAASEPVSLHEYRPVVSVLS